MSKSKFDYTYPSISQKSITLLTDNKLISVGHWIDALSQFWTFHQCSLITTSEIKLRISCNRNVYDIFKLNKDKCLVLPSRQWLLGWSKLNNLSKFNKSIERNELNERTLL